MADWWKLMEERGTRQDKPMKRRAAADRLRRRRQRLPPKVTAKQATKFAEALAKGEPNRAKIALTVLEDKVKEMV